MVGIKQEFHFTLRKEAERSLPPVSRSRHSLTMISETVRDTDSFNKTLIGTYTHPTQQCYFKWPWMTLGDFAKYSMTLSVARSLCYSWASCIGLKGGHDLVYFSFSSMSASVNVKHWIPLVLWACKTFWNDEWKLSVLRIRSRRSLGCAFQTIRPVIDSTERAFLMDRKKHNNVKIVNKKCRISSYYTHRPYALFYRQFTIHTRSRPILGLTPSTL